MTNGNLLAFCIGFLILIGFIFMAFLMSGQQISRFDQSIIDLIQGLESERITPIMKFFTFIGSFSAVLVIFLFMSFILYFGLKCRAEIILFTIVVATTPLINKLLKYFFHRERPHLHRLIEIGGYSFPSGHAMNAFALYGILTFILWNHIRSSAGRIILIIISTIFITMIGTSRIYLGVHYPTDIIGGYFASGIWLTIAIWFYQRLKGNLQKNI